MGALARKIERQGIEKGIAEGITKGIAKGEARGKVIGIAEGIAKGKAEGKAEGIAKGKIEVAKAMLEAGSDLQFVAKVTGLSMAEINKLVKLHV